MTIWLAFTLGMLFYWLCEMLAADIRRLVRKEVTLMLAVAPVAEPEIKKAKVVA